MTEQRFKRARVLPLIATSLGLWAPTGRLVAQETPCSGGSPWSSIGVEAFHCPGGACGFQSSDQGEPAFRFSTEPWLRAIDETGPASGKIREGDVLVAVNGQLVTSQRGGRELARLEPSAAARLTLRRGDQLVDADVRPVLRCGTPLILKGNSVIRSATGPESSPERSSASVLLDERTPRLGNTMSLDLGLGLVLRCAGCQMSLADGEARWTVLEPPVVQAVESGGVADEAGLRAGDRIVEIEGHDVLSETGARLLYAMPERDFEMTYARDGERGTVRMNRRIVTRNIVVDERRQSLQLEREGSGWAPRILSSIARIWREIWTGDDQTRITLRLGGGAPRAAVASGETWGPVGMGVLFRSEGAPLFELDAEGSMRLHRHPIVAVVTQGGPAHAAGLETGDILTHVNDHDLTSREGGQLLLTAQPDISLRLRFERAGRERTTVLTPRQDR